MLKGHQLCCESERYIRRRRRKDLNKDVQVGHANFSHPIRRTWDNYEFYRKSIFQPTFLFNFLFYECVDEM